MLLNIIIFETYFPILFFLKQSFNSKQKAQTPASKDLSIPFMLQKIIKNISVSLKLSNDIVVRTFYNHVIDRENDIMMTRRRRSNV